MQNIAPQIPPTFFVFHPRGHSCSQQFMSYSTYIQYMCIQMKNRHRFKTLQIPVNICVNLPYNRWTTCFVLCFELKLTIHNHFCQCASISHAVAGVAHVLARVLQANPSQHQATGASVALRDHVLLIYLHSQAICTEGQTQYKSNQRSTSTDVCIKKRAIQHILDVNWKAIWLDDVHYHHGQISIIFLTHSTNI